VFLFAIASAIMQFIMSRQQDPTRQKGKKRRTMRDLMREAADGKETNQDEINAVAQSQMTYMMPIMMLFIMINLPGALVFYYLLNNIITVFLQKIILNRNYTEMEAAADKKILKELRDAQEAVVVKDETEAKTTHYLSDSKNKNQKVHITRIKASDKKKRR
jgi:membrane protein insertase Oxa1/YidC/SpoIIIJ